MRAVFNSAKFAVVMAEQIVTEDPEEILPNESAGTRLCRTLGPGLITGAADDDPSGIATYTQAGAQSGYGFGWAMLITFPLMVSVQNIAARIGRTAGVGLAGIFRVASWPRLFPCWCSPIPSTSAPI
jgi:Mn2+/Fe2+ NRAMP family transporter